MIPYGSLWGLWCSQLPSIDHIDPPCLITSFGSVNHPGARPRGEEDVGDGWTIRRHLWCSAEIILRPSSTCSVSRRFKQQFCYAVEGAMIVTHLCIWTPLIIDYKFIIFAGLDWAIRPTNASKLCLVRWGFWSASEQLGAPGTPACNPHVIHGSNM